MVDSRIQKQIDTLSGISILPLTTPLTAPTLTRRVYWYPFIFPPPPQANNVFKVVPAATHSRPQIICHIHCVREIKLDPWEVFVSSWRCHNCSNWIWWRLVCSLFDMRAQAHEEGFMISEQFQRRKRNVSRRNVSRFDHGIDDYDND